MKKILIITLMLSNLSQPAHGMLRAMATRFSRAAQAIRTQTPKVAQAGAKITPAAAHTVQKTFTQAVKTATEPSFFERLGAHINSIRTMFKNYWMQSKKSVHSAWNKHAYGIAPIIPMATVAVAATLLKPKAQEK